MIQAMKRDFDTCNRDVGGAIVLNLGTKPFEITYGMRIAQMVVAHVTQAGFELVEELGQTSRADGGFGSTGVN